MVHQGTGNFPISFSNPTAAVHLEGRRKMETSPASGPRRSAYSGYQLADHFSLPPCIACLRDKAGGAQQADNSGDSPAPCIHNDCPPRHWSSAVTGGVKYTTRDHGQTAHLKGDHVRKGVVGSAPEIASKQKPAAVRDTGFKYHRESQRRSTLYLVILAAIGV